MKTLITAVCFLVGLWASAGYTYVESPGNPPPSPHTMNLQLGCLDDPSHIESWGPCWDDVAAHAITVWNTAGSRFRFGITSHSADPCDHTDGISTIGWSDDLCGYEGGSGARTAAIMIPSRTGTGDHDIILNGTVEWGAYAGPWNPADPPDIHRVILHELGHIVGLGHPNEHGQSVTAIMNSEYAVDMLQPDDINGAIARHQAEDRNLRATFENPPAGGLSSGIGVISGWRCEANGDLTVSFDGGDPIPVVYGSERPDTASVCDGDTDNGFVAIWNWGNLGGGDHSAVVYDDGVPFGQSSFTVGTSGEEFLRGVTATCTVPDFPAPGEAGHFVWSQPTQHLELSHVGPSSMTEEPATCESPVGFDGTWSIVGTVTDSGCAPNHSWSGSFLIAESAISGRVFQSFGGAYEIYGAVAPSGTVSGHLFDTFFKSAAAIFTGTLNQNSGSGTWVETFCFGTWVATKQ